MNKNKITDINQNNLPQEKTPSKKKLYFLRTVLILINIIGIGAFITLNYYSKLLGGGPSSIGLLVIGPPLYYTFLFAIFVDFIFSLIYIIKKKPRKWKLVLPIIVLLVSGYILGTNIYSKLQQYQIHKAYNSNISQQEASQLIKTCKVKMLSKIEVSDGSGTASESSKWIPGVKLDFDHSNGYSSNVLEWNRKTALENFKPLKELARSDKVKEKCGAITIENGLDTPSLTYISEAEAISRMQKCQIGFVGYNMTNYTPEKDKERFSGALDIKQSKTKTNYVVYSLDSWYDVLYITSPGFDPKIASEYDKASIKCDGMEKIDGSTTNGFPYYQYEYPPEYDL
ncbi:MAG: hypothetical protein AAB395_01560 [Patescibacteria group bacterium]